MDDGESVEVSIPQGEADTYELTLAELQRTFEYQVERLREIDTKAIEIHNARVTAVNDMLATVTVLLVIVGFIYVGVGLVVGLLAPGIAVSLAVFVVQTVVLTWLTRVIYRRNRQSDSGLDPEAVHHMDHIAPPPSDTAETFDGVMLSKGTSREDGLVALREMLRGREGV